MIQAIVISILVIILVVAFKATLAHLKGQGGCCGGGSTPIIPDKKLTKPIIKRKQIKIKGMKCDACVARIKKALNKLDDVSAFVSLANSEALIDLSADVNDEILSKCIQKAGYEVLEIIEY